MKVKGNLQVSGTLEGITFTDGTKTYSRRHKVTFQANDFYLTNDGENGPKILLRGVTFKDGNLTVQSQHLQFNGQEFYITRNSANLPQINLKQDDYLPFEQESGAQTNSYLIPNAPWPMRVEQIFGITRSGTASCGFYIVPSATPNKNGTSIPGADGISLSSTATNLNPDAAGATLNVGDALLLSIFSVSSGKNIRLGVKLKRL